MEAVSKAPLRVLAVDVFSRGFGFVVLEGATKPVDWGTRQVVQEKQARTVGKIARLLRLYRPDVLVLEDAAHVRSRRCARIRSLVDAVAMFGRQERIRVALVAVAMVRTVLAGDDVATKDQIAGLVAERLPDLLPLRPPPRKPWMREDERMAIFDAAAFGLAYYGGRNDSRAMRKLPRPLSAPQGGDLSGQKRGV